MQPDAVWRSLSASASFSIDKAPEGVRKASVTFRVTSLLGIQQRWASLQRAPVAGVPYLLALSKSSLNGVLGVECSNHSVPTIFFNDLARFGNDRALLFLGFDPFGHRWVTVSKKLVKCQQPRLLRT